MWKFQEFIVKLNWGCKLTTMLVWKTVWCVLSVSIYLSNSWKWKLSILQLQTDGERTRVKVKRLYVTG